MNQKDSNKKNNVGLTILKIISIFVIVIALIFVGGYLYLKYYLGFDIAKFKNAIELLNKNYSQSQVVTENFSNSDTYSAFNKLFGGNNVYVENEGNYSFSKQNFKNTSIQQDANLSNKEFAGLLNTYVLNILEDADIQNNISLKQVIFSNLVESENQIEIDIKYTFEIELYESLGDDFLSLIFSKYVPKKILLTSKIQLSINKDNMSNFSVLNKEFKINNLSQDQTSSVLSVFETLKILNFKNEVIQTVDNLFVESIFGGETTDGLINSINGSNGYDFLENNGEIFIKIKKV